MAMRKFMILMAATAALCLVAEAGYAKKVSVKLTPQQVATTCGKLIVTAGSRTGCKKSCGEGKTCGYSCNNKGKDCKGTVVEMTGSTPGSLVNPALQGGLLDQGSFGFDAQGPSKGGSPAAPAPAPVQLR